MNLYWVTFLTPFTSLSYILNSPITSWLISVLLYGINQVTIKIRNHLYSLDLPSKYPMT